MSIERLRKALEQYANPDNWEQDASGVFRVWREPDSSTPEAYDGHELGRKALDALASIPEGVEAGDTKWLDAAVEKAWGRFNAALHPRHEQVMELSGEMARKFETHFGFGTWTDVAYRQDASTWASAWFAALASPPQAQQGGQKLWIWKNGDHFWAFDNLYPCFTPGGDPMTLGEPVGYAIFKPSYCRSGRESS